MGKAFTSLQLRPNIGHCKGVGEAKRSMRVHEVNPETQSSVMPHRRLFGLTV